MIEVEDCFLAAVYHASQGTVPHVVGAVCRRRELEKFREFHAVRIFVQ